MSFRQVAAQACACAWAVKTRTDKGNDAISTGDCRENNNVVPSKRGLTRFWKWPIQLGRF
jgi:hypothetical protein